MVSRNELEALRVAADKKRLLARLKQARACLWPDFRSKFGKGRFDFEKRQLIGDNGIILQWRTREHPGEPEGYRNQQTNRGTVLCIRGK